MSLKFSTGNIFVESWILEVTMDPPTQDNAQQI